MNENHLRMIQLWQAFQAKAESKAKADLQATQTPSSNGWRLFRSSRAVRMVIEQLHNVSNYLQMRGFTSEGNRIRPQSCPRGIREKLMDCRTFKGFRRGFIGQL